MIPKVLSVRGPRSISGCTTGDYPPRHVGTRRTADGLQIAHRVNGCAIDADLEVDVRTEAVAGAARGADHLTLLNGLADAHADRRLVRVAGRDPAAVVDAGV